MVWLRCCRQNLCQQLSLSADRAIFYFSVTEGSVDGVQLGHYLDNVFAFRAGLGLKIGLGGMAAEASVLQGPRQAWGLGRENVRGALTMVTI